MPKLKQPVSLQKMSLGVLFEFVVNYCDQLSVKDSLAELRRGVSIIKKHVCNYLPWYLLADFCTKFLEEFYAVERPVSHHKAATEILMDIEIVGLRCNGQILGYLDPNDVHQIRRLQELDLGNVPATISLEKFYLDDLTTFIFPIHCTDLDLAVIGQNCSKLQVLKVPASKVTDNGLRALSLCSELRVVDIVDCEVSYKGMDGLLSVHKKIEEFALLDGTYSKIDGSLVFLRLNSSVCPSINRYAFNNDWEYINFDLQPVVEKFPNLTYFIIGLSISQDLSALKSLNKLTGIEVNFCGDVSPDDFEETCQNLKTLLSFIGANITTLTVTSWEPHFWYQDSIDFVFNSCPNIEYLRFDHGAGIIVIPPFQKLKELVPLVPNKLDGFDVLDSPALEFSNLPDLETLLVLDYEMNLQVIESMMLDDIKFPNLSVIEVNCLKPEDVEHIERIARDNNLDFKIKNHTTDFNYFLANWHR